ncbi:MAG: undecaprenyl-diphosphate phosphatase, partial [Chlamydiae bacterium]|nr:undecaprenyl-diphosphate phosphatase [Chlamydiota bacterium]
WLEHWIVDPKVAGSRPVDRPVFHWASDMSFLQAILLGLIQGITEFFPISSSTHLYLAKKILGVTDEPNLLLFDLSCHLGTLLVVMILFKEELKSFFSHKRSEIKLYFLALLPLFPAYFLLKPLRALATSHMQFIGFSLFLTASFLFAAHFFSRKREEIHRFRDVLYIGAAQSFALIPGISRSGSTIACARLLGWEAKEAVRFSFLLSIPTIAGGMCMESYKALTSVNSSISLTLCLTGFLASAIAGSGMVKMAISILEKGHLKQFGFYCLFLAILATIYLN